MCNRKTIIFVGPQGCGKTTQAELLSKEFESMNCKAHNVSLIQYTFFHHGFINTLKRFCKTCRVMVKFYDDLPAQPFASFEIYRRLFGLLVVLHFVGFTLALARQKLLLLFYSTLVEHEGYVLKQFADLYYFAHLVGVDEQSVVGRLLKRLATFALGSLPGKRISIVHLEGEAGSLKSRYRKRRTHVEPSEYIGFQNRAYDRICKSLDGLIDGVIVKIDSNRSIVNVHNDIMSSIPWTKDL